VSSYPVPYDDRSSVEAVVYVKPETQLISLDFTTAAGNHCDGHDLTYTQVTALHDALDKARHDAAPHEPMTPPDQFKNGQP